MLQVIINVNATSATAHQIKEILAMQLERFGDSKVVEVREITPQDCGKEKHQQQRFF